MIHCGYKSFSLQFEKDVGNGFDSRKDDFQTTGFKFSVDIWQCKKDAIDETEKQNALFRLESSLVSSSREI